MTSHKFLSHYLKAQSKIIISLVPKLFDPLNEKYFHSVRVATRRMRAAFWILKGSPRRQELCDLNLYLKKLGRVLGKIRDVELALIDSKKYQIDVSELRSSQQVLKKKIQKLTTKSELRKLTARLSVARDLAANVNPLLVVEARDNLRLLMDSRIDKKFRRAKKLHQLRIDMKKARYILEAMGEPVEPLKPLQDVLGEAHDLQILRGFVGKSKKLELKEHLLNKKAAQLVRPAMEFAVAQLKSRSLKTDFTKLEIEKRMIK